MPNQIQRSGAARESQIALMKRIESDSFLMDMGGALHLGALMTQANLIVKRLLSMDEDDLHGDPHTAAADVLRAMQMAWCGRPTMLQLARGANRWRLSLVPLRLAGSALVDGLLVLHCHETAKNEATAWTPSVDAAVEGHCTSVAP